MRQLWASICKFIQKWVESCKYQLSLCVCTCMTMCLCVQTLIKCLDADSVCVPVWPCVCVYRYWRVFRQQRRLPACLPQQKWKLLLQLSRQPPVEAGWKELQRWTHHTITLCTPPTTLHPILLTRIYQSHSSVFHIIQCKIEHRYVSLLVRSNFKAIISTNIITSLLVIILLLPNLSYSDGVCLPQLYQWEE